MVEREARYSTLIVDRIRYVPRCRVLGILVELTLTIGLANPARSNHVFACTGAHTSHDVYPVHTPKYSLIDKNTGHLSRVTRWSNHKPACSSTAVPASLNRGFLKSEFSSEAESSVIFMGTGAGQALQPNDKPVRHHLPAKQSH